VQLDTKNLTIRQIQRGKEGGRPMSPWDGFVYNFLTMGVIFPWVYLQGPGAFPGANAEVALLIAFLAQVPISLAYTWLATVLPVNGGDYIYQTRAFGKVGFISVMSGFVVWILQWIAISGTLFATLGLAPLLLSLGVFLKRPVLCEWGVRVQSPSGICFVSLALALGTTVMLTRGMRLYVKVQRYLFICTVTALLLVIGVFVTHHRSFDTNLTIFGRYITDHLPQYSLRTWRPSESFLTFVMANVDRHRRIGPTFNMLHTLAIVPIAWTSLQWATYSVEQNTEIKGADRYHVQTFMLMGPTIAVAALMILLAHAEHTATSLPVLAELSAAYKGYGSPDTTQFMQNFLQPYPSVLAMAIGRSALLAVLIGVGFIANSFQITCNSFIGMSRILVAMSVDGVLPGRLGISSLKAKRHSPNRALWLYFLCSVPFICGNSFSGIWSEACTMGVTIACGYVFAMSCLAATRIPSRMRTFWECSDIHKVPAWTIRVVGYLGATFAFAMVLPYLVMPGLWPGEHPSRILYVAGVGSLLVAVMIAIVGCHKLYEAIAFRRPTVRRKIREIPKELREFYE
jgi:amino acid transporter